MSEPRPETISMTMRDFLNLLFKRKWTLALIFLFFAGGMTGAAVVWPPTYRSIASLYLRSKHETIDQSLVDNPTINRGVNLLLPDVLSEVELVKATEVRRRVIDKLGLDKEPIKAVKPGEKPLDPAAQRAAWDAYLYDNTLVEAATNANVINVTYTDYQPQRAARIVGAYADAYLEFRGTLATEGPPATELETEVDGSSKKLTDAANALAVFNYRWHLYDSATQKTELISLLARTRTQVADERSTLQRALTEHKTYADLLANDLPAAREIGEIRSDVNCQSLETQISNQTLALNDLLQHNKESMDSVVRARKDVEILQKQRDDRIKSILASIVLTKQAAVDSIQAGLSVHEELAKSIEQELTTLVSKAGASDRLNIDLDLVRDHYKIVSRRLNQTRFDALTGGTGNVDVLVANHGVTPNKPFFPPPFVLSALVALVTGLMVAFSCVVVLDILDQSFKTPDEVERHLSAGVLATVPRRAKHRLTTLLEA
jgi:polysaccharide biosynthesis transport protein